VEVEETRLDLGMLARYFLFLFIFTPSAPLAGLFYSAARSLFAFASRAGDWSPFVIIRRDKTGALILIISLKP
jgi:hypothetical protein